MSYYSDASLVMIPSGVKDGTVFSQKPLSSDGQLTFSRGSDIEATRISADGLIHKAQVNLLLQSNTFSTTWFNDATTTTGGQSGYDGTNDAWLLDSTGGFLQQAIPLSGLYTFSVYAKKGTLDGIRLRIDAASDANCYIDLNDGSQIIAYSGAALSVVSVGSGWYRIALTINDATIANVRFYPINLSPSSATGNVYIQDAQLNYGLVAQDYQETTTAAVVSGITDNMPRLNYDPANPTCPSLLLEPSRTNLATRSEYFPTFSSGLSVTQNATTSPEGVQNAAKAVELSGTNTKAITLDSVSYTSGTTYTHSFFAKSSNRYIQMFFSNSLFTTDHANFDLVNGVVGGKSDDVTSSIKDYGNGWYRCTATITAPVTTSVSNLLLLVDDVNATRGQGYTGDGSSFVEIYGFQCEAGSYPTSYIPTYGSSATRSGTDNPSTTFGTPFVQNGGAALIEFKGSVSGGGSSSPYIRLYGNKAGDTYLGFGNTANWRCRIQEDGTAHLYTSPVVKTDDVKLCISYSSTGWAMFANGSKFASGNDNIDLGNIDRLNSIVSDVSGPYDIKQLLLFPSPLTDAEAIALTA